MPKPKFIEEIEKGRKKRIAKKKELDATSLLSKQALAERATETLVAVTSLSRTETLAIDSNQVVPLLSEGTLWQEDFARAYIPRGEIAKMVEKLADDFVGGFNIGHTDYSYDPVNGWVGDWSKEDLTVVDADNDRQRVEISLSGLFTGMSVVRDLALSDRPLGLSVEITHDWDDFVELGDSIVPVWTNLEIIGVAIVGSTGDPVNEASIKLNKEDDMSLLGKKKKEELDAGTATQDPEVKEEVKVDEDASENTEILETAEGAIAEVEEQAKEAEEELAVEALATAKSDLAKITSERDHYKAEFAKLKVHLSELAKSGIMVEKTTLNLKKDQESSTSRYTELVYGELSK